MSENIIELKGLTKRYGYGDTESFALKDFDLTIKRGEFIMIMGPSGCGKTTLLDIIGLLDRATYGDYYLNGENVASISARRQARLRAKKIGFIFQNSQLLPRLTARKNVELPLIYAGVTPGMRKKLATEMLERVGLSDRMNHYPNQLSGGQQQRVAIARALVGNPSILLADEPTGALDQKTGRQIMELFRMLNDEHRTIIMITHDMNIAANARRIVRIIDGEILEGGHVSDA